MYLEQILESERDGSGFYIGLKDTKTSNRADTLTYGCVRTSVLVGWASHRGGLSHRWVVFSAST